MTTRRHAILAVGILLGACGGSAPKPTVDPVAYCVEKTVELYERHSLPFSRPASERPGACRSWMDKNDAHTLAEIDIAMRVFDKQLRDLNN